MVDGATSNSKKIDSNNLLPLAFACRFQQSWFYGLVAVSFQINSKSKRNDAI